MASTSPPSTSSAMSTPAAVDSAALRSCPNCGRRMSSLKHDSHTICSQCRAVSCSVETRCSECKDWSVGAMQDHLKYQRSLARRSSSRKPAVTAASGSQPAVTSSPVGPSNPLAPAVSESSQFKDAVLAVLQSLQGSLGINIDSFTAPFTVPDSAPSVGGATGGVHGMKLHTVDSRLEFPGVGALELPAQTSAISTSLVVHSDKISMLHASTRSYLGMSSVTAADRAAPIGPSPSPLGSSGADQLKAHVVGPLSSSSSALSSTSLLFPLTPSPSFPPSLSSSLPPPPPGSSLSSYSSAVSSLLASVSSSSSSPIPSISPAFTPSSLASASFPSSSFVSPSLPHASSSLYPPTSSSSSSSLYHHPLSSSSSFLSSPLPSASTSVSSHHGKRKRKQGNQEEEVLLVSLLPLSLPRLLLPPTLLLFHLLLFRRMLPLPLFSQLLLPLLAGFLLPLPFPFSLLLPLPLVLFLPWRTTRRICWDCRLNISL